MLNSFIKYNKNLKTLLTVDIIVIVNKTVLSNAKSLVQSSVVSYPSSMAVKTNLRKE